MRLKPVGKIVVLLIVIGAAVGGYRVWKDGGLGGLIPDAQTSASKVPPKADLPDVDQSAVSSLAGNKFTMPGAGAGCTDKPEVRMLVWAWNAQMGLMFANGGKQSTDGSEMCSNGVNLKLIRQDDSSKMQEALVKFATELKHGNQNSPEGAQFVAVMGDGSAAFLKGLNDNLKRLGSNYLAKVVGSAGYSRGEDKLMGPQDWKDNPGASRGGVVCGVLRDGDWNIAMKWAADNGIKNNPDEKTWDPDAINWIAANDYIDAGEKYIAGYTEERPVVRNGKKTGQTKRITVQGVVTWTPGDVNVATKKGGLVSIVSTKQYSSQMPNVIIGIDKWMRDNRPSVEGMLSAIFRGGEAVRSSQSALQKAGEVSAAVYGEQDADYWVKYYKGTKQADKQGLEVDLGGSSVNTLADDMVLFGLVKGAGNLFAATYTVFADIVKDQYPSLMPSYYPVDSILDTSYVASIAKKTQGNMKLAVASVTKTYKSTGGGGNKPVVSRRSWHIQFATGSAGFTKYSVLTLEQLRQQLLVAGGTSIEVHGHTDNVGNPQANTALSESRAFAVKHYLEAKSPVNFPEGRIRVFAHGAENPVAPNSSEAGRAQNRRVEIVLRSNVE